MSKRNFFHRLYNSQIFVNRPGLIHGPIRLEFHCQICHIPGKRGGDGDKALQLLQEKHHLAYPCAGVAGAVKAPSVILCADLPGSSTVTCSYATALSSPNRGIPLCSNFSASVASTPSHPPHEARH